MQYSNPAIGTLYVRRVLVCIGSLKRKERMYIEYLAFMAQCHSCEPGDLREPDLNRMIMDMRAYYHRI